MVPNADSDDVRLVPDHREADDAWAPPLTEPPEPADHAHRATPAFKYTSFDDRPGSTHNLVVGLVPPGARVLEVGCATGYMSEVLRDRLGCTVVGLEIDPAAAAEAAGRADRVLVGDVETLDLDALLPGERYDAIVFADVLEHLHEPHRVLERARALLADGGAVVSSVPNVAHISVRLALLAGEFRYRDTGLMDETHRRFFTRASLLDLFEATGFAVIRWQRTRRSLEESEVEVPRGLSPDIAATVLAGDPEATTYQFVVRAVPADHATELAEVRRVTEEREAALHQALDDLGDMRAQLIGAQAVLREREEQMERMDAQVEALEHENERLADLLAQAGAALDRARLVRMARALDARAPALAAALRRLRGRAG
jgi:2-polyprenyl-3-methyl-5-hydroxy-6-metoxy-1,4-benzoquinol methylase